MKTMKAEPMRSMAVAALAAQEDEREGAAGPGLLAGAVLARGNLRGGGRGDDPLVAEEYWVRHAEELTGAGLFAAAWRQRGKRIVYEVWRGVRWRPTGDGLAADVRLDFTLLHPGEVAGELYRTAGHVHRAEGGLSFGEIYQVLSGAALFVLVRPLQERWAVLAVEAGPGDTVVIPPPYGHFTVNVGEEPLLCANLVDRRCGGDYDAFRRWGARCWVLRRAADPEEAAGGHSADPWAAARLVAETAAGHSVNVARVRRGQRAPWVARGLPPLWQLPPWVRGHALGFLVTGAADGAPGAPPIAPPSRGRGKVAQGG